MKKVSMFFISVLFSTLCMGADVSINYGGEVVKVKGKFPSVGSKAPAARVTQPDFSIKTVGGKTDRVQVIVTVPSIDTPICSAQSKRFDDEIKKFPEVDMTVVSMDLPYADDRFCKGQGIQNISIASDFAYGEVGENYGVVVTGGELKGLLIRAIFIVGKNGRIIYQEIVKDINKEPDYNKVMEAIKTANASK
ncbi:MAG: thioredoxin-dependent peroxiredoxin [Campylobacterota bacterium]|nr:thioredoxin-dependent peroxiredoxin [Campylobacterota bacterium]MDQ1267581.1 thioredoxin-dependent peroxiredoxin [Campylobacterota bacterium]MDQ1338119.1 thioredoxin-dependent peroxiredoxin [Campylobacterota bacterium]